MNVPLQLVMGITPAHRNQYLFSDHYLDHLLPQDPRWESTQSEAEEFMVWLQGLYTQEQSQLPQYNETQLEEHWFKPILTQLGHVFEGQAGIPGLDTGVKRPDYVLFPDESTRQAAVSAQNTGEYAADALAVGEVKRWEVPLSKKQKGGGASFEAQNPSWQIDYYLRATGLDWGILSNGRRWRLVHQDSSQRLSIYYEVDLVDLLSRGDAGVMRYFTLFFDQSAFRPDAQGRVFLADALAESHAYAVALEEDVETNVYQALERLMQGFLDLPANGLGTDDLRAIYENSLYLLYRLLFILYGESRGLLPLHLTSYRDNYSLDRVKREIAELNTRPAPMTTLYWGRLKQLFQIINGDNVALNRHLGVPRYNGGLFDPQLHPFLEQYAVGDRALVDAIDLLSRRKTETGREFVDYRTLGVRHLGSIYEGLLEYQPRYATEPTVAVRDNKGEHWVQAMEAPAGARVIDRREAGQVYLETDRGERKATGSYYTPQYIAEYIVENTLGPLVEEAVERVKKRAKEARGKAARAAAEQSLVDEILSLKTLDPAMGSGHFLVEATEYLARTLATDPYVETEAPVEEDLTYWKRRVVERCIYGVDKNPLAVELAKLSLWLATVAADKPLSFLDHHLKCGDSLIGARVDDLGAVPPVMLSKKALREREVQYAAGVRQANLFETRLIEKLPVVMGRILEITEVESDSYETVQAKEAADQAVQELKAPFQAVADLWVSGHFGNEFTQGEYDEALGLIGQPCKLMALDVVLEAQEMAHARRFFHWELAFPEVIYDCHGQPLRNRAGFDAVLGNPPYVNLDRLESLQSKYLSVAYPDIWMGQTDYLYFFVACGIENLGNGGSLGYITARYFIEAYFASGFREFLQRNASITSIVDFRNHTVFKGVGTKTCLLFLRKECDENKRIANRVNIYLVPDQQASDCQVVTALAGRSLTPPFEHIMFPQSELLPEHWRFVPANESAIVERVSRLSWQLGDMCRIGMGMQTGANSVFEVTPRVIQELEIEPRVLKKIVSNMEIHRYTFDYSERYWIYTEPFGERALRLFPNTIKYLEKHRGRLEDRIAFRRGDCRWYQFSYPRHVDKYDSPKIVTPFIAPSNRFALDQTGEIYSSTDSQVVFPLEGFPVGLEYVVALLNSRFLNWRHRHLGKLKDYRYEYSRESLSALPIRRIEFSTPTDERERLGERAKVEASEAVSALMASNAIGTDSPLDRAMLSRAVLPVLDFVGEQLANQPEQADVIHDLLCHLAEQMITLNKEKQAVIEAFWLDLEGVAEKAAFETLRAKGKQERTLWNKAQPCRPFVDEHSHSTCRLDESLGWNEDAFKAFVKILVGKVQGFSDLVAIYRAHSPTYRELVARVEATDCLIDQIVYKLYGLTEEEIAIVEGREQ